MSEMIRLQWGRPLPVLVKSGVRLAPVPLVIRNDVEPRGTEATHGR